MNQTSSDHEIAMKCYEIAVSQFQMRVKQRDVVLLFYVASTGTVFGIGLKDTGNPWVLFGIPFIAGACGILMAYHSALIEAIIRHCNEQVFPNIGNSFDLFEESSAFATLAMKGVKFRIIGVFLILITTVVFSLWHLSTKVELFIIHYLLSVAASGVGILALLWADVVHIKSVRKRTPKR